MHLDASRGGPGLDAWLASVRRHIATCDMVVAQELVTAAQKIFRDAELAEINVAVAMDPLLAHTHSNFAIEYARSEVERLRQKGKSFRPPEPEPERTLPPRPGSTAYVAATRLQLLEEPRETAAVAGHLPIGATVEVLEINGTWAKVRSSGPLAGADTCEVKEGVARSVTLYGPVSEGCAPWASFSGRPLVAAELLERAGDFERAGRYPEAFRDLKRVAALDTPSVGLSRATRK